MHSHKKTKHHHHKHSRYKTSPIKVKVMLYYGATYDFGHIGVKAWVPGSRHRYCIHFVRDLESTTDWGFKWNDKNADEDTETCERSFVFDSPRTLAELKKWHKHSKFYDKSDWNIYHNCADAIHKLMHDFFGIEINQFKNCLKTPFSTSLWASTKIALPRSLYAAIENAVNNTPRLTTGCK